MRTEQNERANISEPAQLETDLESEPIVDLPYNDDPEWNASLEKSLPALEKLAARALNNYHKVKLNKLPHDK